MLTFRVNFAIQPRSPSPKHFTAFLPSQTQFWLTPFFSQPSVLPLPQLLSFDNHLDCPCPNSKTPLSRSVMSSNPSPINNIANSRGHRLRPRTQHRRSNQTEAPAHAGARPGPKALVIHHDVFSTERKLRISPWEQQQAIHAKDSAHPQHGTASAKTRCLQIRCRLPSSRQVRPS